MLFWLRTKSSRRRAESAGGHPDLEGQYYCDVLKDIHSRLSPSRYLEIGVRNGRSLFLAHRAAIGIDPQFTFDAQQLASWVSKIDEAHLFQETSDHFFERRSPQTILQGTIDFAFLDGMHWCEFLLRDFSNAEKHGHRGSIIALHDCLPVEAGIALRTHRPELISDKRKNWWAGDVWKTALAIKRHRPDLRMLALDAAPTGLVLITNLDPDNDILIRNYEAIVAEMAEYDLSAIGIENLFAEMDVKKTRDWFDLLAAPSFMDRNQ